MGRGRDSKRGDEEVVLECVDAGHELLVGVRGER